jgi:phage I-like protein
MNARHLIMNTAPSVWTQPTDFTPADAEGWIHLSPIGSFSGRDAEGMEVMQVVTRDSLDGLVRQWNSAGRTELLIDEDHFSHDDDKSTEALGWIQDLQVRDNGLWGKPRWTDVGLTAVQNGRFRYVSPVWDCEGEKDLRPAVLRDVALTNKPNLRGLVPITNRQTTPPKAEPKANNRGQNMDYKALLLKKLGLSADATDEQIATACEGPTTTELETEMNRCQTEIANRELDEAGVTEESDRDAIRPVLISNREAGKVIINKLKAKTVVPAAPAPRAPITNRATAKTPEGEGKPVMNRLKDQQQHLAVVRNRLGAAATHDAVWAAATAEKPELYDAAQS